MASSHPQARDKRQSGGQNSRILSNRYFLLSIDRPGSSLSGCQPWSLCRRISLIHRVLDVHAVASCGDSFESTLLEKGIKVAGPVVRGYDYHELGMVDMVDLSWLFRQYRQDSPRQNALFIGSKLGMLTMIWSFRSTITMEVVCAVPNSSMSLAPFPVSSIRYRKWFYSWSCRPHSCMYVCVFMQALITAHHLHFHCSPPIHANVLAVYQCSLHDPSSLKYGCLTCCLQ